MLTKVNIECKNEQATTLCDINLFCRTSIMLENKIVNSVLLSSLFYLILQICTSIPGVWTCGHKCLATALTKMIALVQKLVRSKNGGVV